MTHSKNHERLQIIRSYREATGADSVDLHEVAKFAIAMGCTLPPPVDPVDRLARELARAARAEYRYDDKIKGSYRANHAFVGVRNGVQTTLWFDIDESNRFQMQSSLTLRREQMVSDGVQLTRDAEHWNLTNPDEQPIQIELDLTLDVEWRKNSPDDEQEAS